jgi:hypothetical protein
MIWWEEFFERRVRVGNMVSAATPSDVRKVFDLPRRPSIIRAMPDSGRSPMNSIQHYR